MSDRWQDVTNLRECLRHRERELAAVRRITAALHAKISLHDLVRDTLRTAVDTMDAAAGSVLLYDRETDELVFRYVIGRKAPELTGCRMPVSEGIIGRVFQSGVAEITPNAQAEPAHSKRFDLQTRFRTRNMVTVPLKTMEGDAIGGMQVLNKRRGIFTDEDLAVLEILAAQAASAMETGMLYEQAKVAAVAKTVGDISHDIKNMITPSMGGAQTLQLMLQEMFSRLEALSAMRREGIPWSEIEPVIRETKSLFPEFCQMIYDGAIAVQQRTRRIAEAVKGAISPPVFRPARPAAIAECVLRDLRLPAERADVEMTLEAPDDCVIADLDSDYLYNALYNLVNNALPETPAGGRVTVRVRVEPDHRRPDGGALRIEVTDTGRGMARHVRENLFTDRAVSTKPDGTGLGTRIVKQAIDLHGGTIEVESAPGQGTTFTIRLPIRQRDAVVAAQ
jgi:signal transduction histidine kinase